MTGLIILIILIPVVLFVLLITILNRSSAQQKLLESMYDRIKELSNQVAALKNALKEKKDPQPGEQYLKEPSPKTPSVTPLYKEEKLKEPVQEKKPEPVKEKISEPAAPIEKEVAAAGIQFTESKEIKEKATATYEEAGSSKESRLQKNPDLEKFIGENLANKIGIAVLVLGISFFVKYAIDNDWVNEIGRVVIGLVSGGILIVLAHRFRHTYRSFSSVLVGGGITVFYFTIAFAFHEYQLIGQQAAFVIMVLITAFAILLSILYNRLELAVIATIGGFITPFLVSTGNENYIALFTYLAILNAGLMVLAWFKRWSSIHTIALFFTLIIYGGWLINRTLFTETENFPYKDALFFATLFYVQFVIMSILNNLRLKKSFTAFDFIILLSINFLYYAAGMVSLKYLDGGQLRGLFTAALAVVNFLPAIIFYRNKKTDRNFVFLLIGLTLTFVSLVAPVQFDGNHITLFWAAESAVLLWLFQKSGITLVKTTSLIVSALMLGSLIKDWSQVYFAANGAIPVMLNKGFTTSIAVSISLFIYYWLMKKEANSYYLREITNKAVRNSFLSAGIIIFYLAGVLEIYYQFSTKVPAIPLYAVYLQLYSLAYAIVLLLLFRRSPYRPLLRFALTILSFTLYLINLRTNNELSFEMLRSGSHQKHFIAHWIAFILLLKLLYDLIMFFKKNNASWWQYQKTFTWIVSASVVLLFSVEMYLAVLWTNYRESDWHYWENLYYKAGLSILWGFCSFAMIWLGMKYRFRSLRIISLTLFTITLVKLFVYDISNIPAGGKIAAFILLGVLLLTVSFMYQRLKKIIIDDIA